MHISITQYYVVNEIYDAATEKVQELDYCRNLVWSP